MRLSAILAIAFTSASSLGAFSSAVPANVYRRNVPDLAPSDEHGLQHRQAMPDLPNLSEDQLSELKRIYETYQSAKSVNEFADVVSKARPGKALQELAKAVGGGRLAGTVRSNIDKFPGQPQTVVFTYLLGLGQCLLQGKSLSEANDCGKDQVRALPDNGSVSLPEPCNNYLGQLEIFGTGWPAKCHDPKVITHPQGNSVHRKIKWALCKAFSWGAPKVRGPSCDERFPTDQEIKNALCEKYFGGSPCGGTMPLNTEADFQKVIAQREAYLKSLDAFTGYQATTELQAEAPEIFRGPNSVPLSQETCYGRKCGEMCINGKDCLPTREVCNPQCRTDVGADGQCLCGWDQFRQECNSCHVDGCGECVLKPLVMENGKFFTRDGREALHVECQLRYYVNECFFVPDGAS